MNIFMYLTCSQTCWQVPPLEDLTIGKLRTINFQPRIWCPCHYWNDEPEAGESDRICRQFLVIVFLLKLVLNYREKIPSRIKLHMKLEMTMTQPHPPSGGRGISSISSSLITFGSDPTLNFGVEPIVIITGLGLLPVSFLSSIASMFFKFLFYFSNN